MKEDKILKDIKEYLESKGWKVLLIGDIKIEQREQGIKKYKYEFVIDFVGKKVN